MRHLERSACLLLIAAALAAVAAPAQAAPANPFYTAASRLEAALRTAVERQPEGLLKSLGASERVCELGEGAEARGEAASAEADWSTLDQAVAFLDEPGVRGVRRALAAARSELSEFESTYSRAWRREPSRVRSLRRDADRIRRGIGDVAAALGTLDAAFAAWRDRGCEAALAATATSNRSAGAGVERIAGGMERLWILGLSVG